MLAEALGEVLSQHFGGTGYKEGRPPGAIATFPAAHHEVGDAVVRDEGDVATVEIGKISHAHFYLDDYVGRRTVREVLRRVPRPERLPPEEASRRVAVDVVEFLRDLFADRVLMWDAGAQSGLFANLDENDLTEEEHAGLREDLPDDTKFWLWSGPTSRPRFLAG